MACRTRGADVAPITVRINEASRLTGVGRTKIYELISDGTLRLVKVGRASLIPMEDLHRLIAVRPTPLPTPPAAPSPNATI